MQVGRSKAENTGLKIFKMPHLAKLFLSVALILAFVPNGFASAAECETAILDCGDGGSSAIYNTIQTVISIMSVTAGILAAAGITFVGIQYLTAGGNEEKTRKAKRRMFEIVIGIILYALLAALVNWLVPKDI